MNYSISSKTYNFIQDQKISQIWLNKFTLFSCLLLITFVSILDPGQHQQNAGPDAGYKMSIYEYIFNI